MFGRAVVVSLIATQLCACDGVFGLDELPPVEQGAGEIKIETSAHTHAKEASSVTFTVVGVEPSAGAQVLVVFAAVGSYCNDPLVPTATVSFDGTSPIVLGTVTGTACDATLSRSYLWLYADPPSGPHDVVVTLVAPAHSLHAGGVLASGVDPDNPVRTVMSGSGRDGGSSVDVASADGDVVLSFVAQGTGIVDPGGGNTVLYQDNVDDGTTLDNSAASTLDGAAPSVTAAWTFSVEDEWQAIACSLRVAP